MPTMNNQNPYARGTSAPYADNQAGNRRHSIDSSEGLGRTNPAFNWHDVVEGSRNRIPRVQSIRRISSAPELPTTAETATGAQKRNATAEKLKAAGFGIAGLGAFALVTGIVASVILSALGAVVVPFIVPLIVVTIAVAFIGAALIAIGNYKASQDAKPQEGAASTQMADTAIQQVETTSDDWSDIDEAGARGASPEPEFKLPRPPSPDYPESLMTPEEIEEYITKTSKNHYRAYNAELMGKQKDEMDGMRNVVLRKPDGSTERGSIFRYVDTFPNMGHVVSVDGNKNALISDLNSGGFSNLGYATQFPKYGMLGDFFQAIIHEGIDLVNPISQPKDIKQHGLFPYWLPENNRAYKASDGTMYKVESKQIRENDPKYQAGSGKNLYQLTVSWVGKDGKDQTHDLCVLHIDDWQDHGAVNAADLKGYVQARMENAGAKGKTLTHCTAGVGRTGTLIVAQSMMEHPETPLIDVVDSLRERRSYTCVQSHSQAALLAELANNLKAQGLKAQGDDASNSDIEQPIVPTRAPHIAPILPKYGRDESDEEQAPPPPPRQPIRQPQWGEIKIPRASIRAGSPDGASQRMPRADGVRPQFDAQQLLSRHFLLKVKIEAAMQVHPNFHRLRFIPEGENGKAAVKALPVGSKEVLMWPSNSFGDKFAYGIKTETGQPLYFLMDEKASFDTVREELGKQLER